MAYPKGAPRPEGAGRPKGGLNKKTLLVREILDSHGINLIEQILLRVKEVDRVEQLRTMVQLLPYVYPKLVATEISGSLGAAPTIFQRLNGDEIVIGAIPEENNGKDNSDDGASAGSKEDNIQDLPSTSVEEV